MIGCTEAGRNTFADTEAAALDTATAGLEPVGAAATNATDDETTAAEAQELLARGAGPLILFAGTSLTAGLGLPEAQSFPLLIAERIEQAGFPHRVVNAGVSGETSAGLLSRADWLLEQPIALIIVETGANDMLRGMPPEVTEQNIQAFLDRIRARHPHAQVVLAGMRALPNLGTEYARRFEPIYPRIAERNGIVLVPFLLEGVAGESELNQADGIHPTAQGHRIIAEQVWGVLSEIVPELR